MSRALVVDDNDDNLYLLTALLGGHGWQVETAHHGAEALLKARQSPPAIVVSDLLMPVMDGYTLLRHWKTDDHLRRVPFIVYTATYTQPEDEQLALDLGADAFIRKPTEPEALIAYIRAIEQRGPAPPPLRTELLVADDTDLLRDYSQTLIRKLEQKSLELEDSNRRLQDDISARQVAERSLRDSEERFRQLAESIEDVFWLSDPGKQTMFYVSPAYETIWGRSRDSLYASASAWTDAIHVDDRERVQASLLEQATGNWESTYRIMTPDGVQRWIRDRSYPVRDVSGHIYRVAGVARDITAYRCLEEQLRHAQKMEAVGRLAGGVAHDFNNMLSVILSYAEVMLEELAAGSPMHNDLQEIRRAGERARDLTRQLLAFSRQQVIEPTVIDLSRVVLDTDKMLRRLLGDDVELILGTARPGCHVHADLGQIEQIVVNLAVNARDAMPGAGTLTIEVSQVDLGASDVAIYPGLGPGRYVLLTVTDTGVGMDAATQERIFEPFFTTKESSKGTGLGLSTVFGIVAQSRGHIDVASRPGAGTTFKIYLPATDRPATTVTVPPPATTLRGSETVLVVEDDQQVREVSTIILRRAGYHVLDASSATEALEVSARDRGRIHLLVTDVVMPRMSGPDLAERLTRTRPELKVLFVSGYTESAAIHDGVVEAGLSFLSKPITPELLLRKVRDVLDAAPS